MLEDLQALQRQLEHSHNTQMAHLQFVVSELQSGTTNLREVIIAICDSAIEDFWYGTIKCPNDYAHIKNPYNYLLGKFMDSQHLAAMLTIMAINHGMWYDEEDEEC